jgi:DNA-binding Lrp family transcriptional regulator
LKTSLITAAEVDYRIVPLPYLHTLAEAATAIGVSPARLSRILRLIQIEVYRKGYTLLLDERAIVMAQAAIKERRVRPGPKRRASPSGPRSN